MIDRFSKSFLAASVLLLAGCGNLFSGWDWGKSTSTEQPEPAPVAVKEKPAPPPADEKVARKNLSDEDQKRIGEYLDQYPADDLSRKVEDQAGASESPPTTQPAGVPVVMKEKPAPLAKSAAAGGQKGTAPKGLAKAVVKTPTPAASDAGAQKSPGAGKPVRANEPVAQVKPNPAPKAEAKPPAKPVLRTVRIGEAPPVKDAKPVSPTGTNSAVSTAPPPARRTLADLIADLEKKVADQPNDFPSQFKLRLLLAADGQTEKAAAVTSGMNQEMAEILTGLFRVIRSAGAAAEDPVTGAASALESLDGLRRIVRNYTQLQIPKVALCTRVDSYGVYEAMKTPVFIAGKPNQQVIVYTEVKNFTNQETSDGLFKTVLVQRLEILAPNGRSEWSVEEPNIVDVSHNAREDFFLTQLIELPPNLSPGKYLLKVSIEDRLSNRAQEEVVEFNVRPQALASHPDE